MEYKTYYTADNYVYKGKKCKVEDNELLVAVKNKQKNFLGQLYEV